jgi:replicative DNA helicase
MRTAITDFERVANVRSGSGTNWSENGADRQAEFDARKNRDFTKKMPMFLDPLTDATGGAERGDVLTIHASTGIGKSWLGLLQSLVGNRSGFSVLIESGEMSQPENMFRLDTLEGGFSNRGLWTGQLDKTIEATYRVYLEGFTAGNGRAPVIVKTPHEWPDGLTIAQLDSDIDRTKADIVVIDHFGLCRFGAGKHAARDFSRELKQLAARKGVIIVLLYQANGDYLRNKTTKDETTGIRELRIPELGDYSDTVAVLQDSSFVIGFDAVMWKDEDTQRWRGKALAGITKSRTGGIGTNVEIDWLPNDGIIRPRQASDVF